MPSEHWERSRLSSSTALAALMACTCGWLAAVDAPVESAQELTLDLGKQVTLKLALIPAGTFVMGSPENEVGRFANEGPQHEVTISRSFYMSIYTITQQQYEALMPTNPSRFKGADLPVQPMSWEDISGFCQTLSAKTGKIARLPTEAEWEYACRAGTRTTWYFGDDPKDAAEYGWFNVKEPHAVGLKQPNAWGLFDMHGNISQVCSDLAANYPKDTLANYTTEAVTDPTGPTTGMHHVARSQGGWVGNCRSAGHRGAFAHTEYSDHLFGIRLVVETVKPR